MLDSTAEQRIRQELASLRIEVDSSLSDPEVTLARGPSHQRYRIAHDTDTAETEPWRADLPFLVVSAHLTERISSRLRKNGIQYVDASGNASLQFAGTVIEIRGRRAARESSPGTRAAERKDSGSNLFSSRRAQVAFALLCWPELLRSSVREIASVARVSDGAAHGTLDLLTQAGYVTAGTVRNWKRPAELMDAWLAAYPIGLGATLTLKEFSGDIDRVKIPHDRQAIFVSGESSFDPHLVREPAFPSLLLHPATLTLYVNHFEPELALLNRWRVTDAPNIFVRRAFWDAPRWKSSPHGLRTAPALLLIADLLATGEPRQRDVAQDLQEAERARLRAL